VALLLAAAVAPATGCRDDDNGKLPLERAEPDAVAPEPDQLGTRRGATLQALRLPHSAVADKLGAHRLTSESELVSRVPERDERTVVQETTLRVDAEGNYAAVKHTDPHHGQEVIRVGDRLYSRLRHSTFVPREPRRGEAAELADRMVGHLPAYIRLLGPHLAVKRVGSETHQGRKVIAVALSARGEAAEAAEPGPGAAGRWRETVEVKALQGRALLDAELAFPLRVKLEARWTFTPPAPGQDPASGIPEELDEGKRGTMELTFEQSISHLGDVEAVKPPPEEEVMDDTRRRRLELERQILSGERSVPHDWRKIP
jgi:hypothetical protein